MTPPPEGTNDTHTVRPRWTWAGLAVLIAGLAVSGWGVIVLSWTWSLAGVALLLVGTVIAWHGGLLYDVRSRGGGQELQEVIHGDEHPGPDPDVGIGGPAREHAAEVDRMHAEVLESRRAARGRPALAAVGATTGLVVCGWLILVQSSALGYPLLSDDTLARDTGVGIVAALAAWRILLVGPQRLTAGLLVACGAAYVLFGLALPHLTHDGVYSETISGGLLVVAGVLAAADRREGRVAGRRAAR